MKYAELTARFRSRPFFEARELDIVYDEPYRQIRFRLSRWVKQNKLIQIRRGYYLLPPTERAVEPSLYAVSNLLYQPSYISLHSALEYYGLIPEGVKRIEAVSPRQTANWNTPLAHFRYSSIKQTAFREYEYLDSENRHRDQQAFFMAAPHKALLDLFHFHSGEWTSERIREMRFQQTEQIDSEKLLKTARWFDAPRIDKAVHKFLQVTGIT